MLSAPLGALTPQCGSYFSRRRFFFYYSRRRYRTTPAGGTLLPQEEHYSLRRNTTPTGGTLLPQEETSPLPQEEHYSLRRYSIVHSPRIYKLRNHKQLKKKNKKKTLKRLLYQHNLSKVFQIFHIGSDFIEIRYDDYDQLIMMTL